MSSLKMWQRILINTWSKVFGHMITIPFRLHFAARVASRWNHSCWSNNRIINFMYFNLSPQHKISLPSIIMIRYGTKVITIYYSNINHWSYMPHNPPVNINYYTVRYLTPCSIKCLLHLDSFLTSFVKDYQGV